MSKLLEIFGKAITVKPSDLVWHWLNMMVRKEKGNCEFIYEERLERLNSILEVMATMDLEKASETIEQYIREFPDCTKGRMAEIAVLLVEDKYAQSIQKLQWIYMHEPANTMALYTLGFCYEVTGHEIEAIDFYQDCIKFKSYLVLPRQRLAAIYFKNGQFDRAIKEYEFITSEFLDDISSMVMLGYMFLSNKDYENAIEIFNTSIISHPDNFQSDQEYDDIQQIIAEGDLDEAMERVQWLLEQVGEVPDLIVKMGDVHRAGRNYSEAVACYEKALHLQPSYLEATIKLGTLYLAMERHSLASEQFNRAVEVNDEMVDSYIGLATSEAMAGKVKSAKKTLELAGSIQKNATLLFTETATLHFQASFNEGFNPQVNRNVMIDSVIEMHKKIIKKNPGQMEMHYRLGMMYMGIGQTAKAASEFEKSLNIVSIHHRSRSKLAICLLEMGDTDKAIEVLCDNVVFGTDSLDLHYQTAILYSKKNDFISKIYKLEKKVSYKYTEAAINMGLQTVLENLGLIDRAAASWQRLNDFATLAVDVKDV